jgi:hypothetical protein
MQHLSDYEAMMINYGMLENVFGRSDTQLILTSLRNRMIGGLVNANYDNPYEDGGDY